MATLAASAVAAAGLTTVMASPAFAVTLPTYQVGQRPNATRVTFPVGDFVSASVDVGTGNLAVLTSDLKLPGIQGDLQLGMAFNSLLIGANQLPSCACGWKGAGGFGWAQRFGPDVHLNVNTDNSVSYFAPDGLQGTFTPAGGSAYTSPTGFKASLVGSSSTGWTLTDHGSGTTATFTSGGVLTHVADRNNQLTTVSTTAGVTTITSTRGGASSKKATLTVDGSGLAQTVKQSNDSSGSRTVTYAYTGGQLSTITDATGRVTRFGYAAAPTGYGGDLTSITNTAGVVTTIGYDGAHRVISVSRANPGGTAAATRLAYPSGSQTLLAGPNTNQGQPVSAVPHTTYTLDSTARVTAAVDPLNHSRSTTYTPFADVATATSAAGGVTSFAHDPAVNAGESLTGVTTASGASGTLTYTGSGPTQYLPTGGTDPQGNSATYAYDGLGNPLSNANGATGATASVTYNSDGTLATSTSPAGQVSTYAVNAAKHQITGLTPPSGSGLGAVTFGYDGYSRLSSVTDGRGDKATYTYDDLDRVTSIAYTGPGTATTTVAYTFDTAGNVKTRTDTTGTTTFGYDGLNRLTSRTDGAGTTIGYGYDPASNLISSSNALGATTYGYDDANQLTTRTAPGGSVDRYLYNPDGKRTDTYWRSNAALTTFLAHTRTDFDLSGRVARTWTARNSSDTTRVFDTSYCYSPDTEGGCPSGQSGTDKALVQWSVDNLTAAKSAYGYDGANRLVDATNYNGHSYHYAYDANGNRTSVTIDGTVTQSLTFNAASNQISSPGYGYDAAGNLTSDPAAGTLGYNKAGQMISRGGTTSYTYAGTGHAELTHENAPSGTYDYTYGRTTRQGVPTLEIVKKGTNTAYMENDPATGQPQSMALDGGKKEYLATDGQGSIVAMIESTTGNVVATYTYDPYGTLTTTTGTPYALQPYRHTSGITDPSTNWTRHGTRYNDTTTGRWTTQDPITRLNDPNRANPYTYAGYCPNNNSDSTGLLHIVSWRRAGFVGTFGTAIALGLSGIGALFFFASVATIGSEYVALDACGY